MATPYLEVRADYDATTMVVYQAYRPDIAEAAVRAQRFVPPFSLGRMTWIKPSFLWMLERSGWATKPGQEHILAVRITRAGWEQALAAARLSSQDTRGALVVVQWDPERNVRGSKLDYRSIQVGLGREIVREYVEQWTTEIRDVTDLVTRMRQLRDEHAWDQITQMLPPEHPYPLLPFIRRRLGMPEAP